MSERHLILRVENADGVSDAVQSFLNEHDTGHVEEVSAATPIVIESLGDKAFVYVTKVVQCDLHDILRLLEER